MEGGFRVETVGTNLDTSEGDFFSISSDDKRLSRVLIIQHSSGLGDVQILIANVLDRSDYPDFGRGRDLVCGSRERDLEIIRGANSSGLGVSTDGRETKSKESQREYSDAMECRGSRSLIEGRCV